MALANMSIRIAKRTKIITDAKGKVTKQLRQSSVAGAAYRSGEDLKDEVEKKTHAYSPRAKDVWDKFILAPDGAPEWAWDRESLWNANERVNTRKDSQLYRDIRISLQRELPTQAQSQMISVFVQDHFVSKGMVADIAVHIDQNNHNPHVHVMLTMNHLEEKGFGKKNRDWNEFIPLYDGKQHGQWGTAKHATDLREDLGNRFNTLFEQFDSDMRINYASYEKQGVNRHGANIPREAIILEKQGQRTDLGDKAALAKALNSAIISTEIFEEKLKTQYNAPDRHSFIQRTQNWWSGFLGKVQDLPNQLRGQWDALFHRQALPPTPDKAAERD